MAIVINANDGTISGISVGGLPDGTVDAGTLATNSVDSAELIDGAIDTAHLASGVGGKILQVVSATSNSATNVTTSWTDISGAAVTITPSAATSKILLFFNAGGMTGSVGNSHLSFKINSSEDGDIVYIVRYGYSDNSGGYKPLPLSLTYVDSPNSTSAITYKVIGLAGGNDFNINSNPSSGSNAVNAIAMEIGA